VGGDHRVRDLWERADLGAAGRLRVDLAPHASALFRVGAARQGPSSRTRER
jgi:hypothetical protein